MLHVLPVLLLVIGPGLSACTFFTNYYYFPSPHPLHGVPDLGVGGGRAGSRRGDVQRGPWRGVRERFLPFFLAAHCAVCKATVTGALSRPRPGGPQPARLVKRFLLTYSSLFLLGDRLDRFTHEHRKSRVSCTAAVPKVILDRSRLTLSLCRVFKGPLSQWLALHSQLRRGGRGSV